MNAARPAVQHHHGSPLRIAALLDIDGVPVAHVQRMKKTLAYISHGLEGSFEYEMRRARTPEDFFRICRSHLDHDAPLPALPPADSKLFCGFEALIRQ